MKKRSKKFYLSSEAKIGIAVTIFLLVVFGFIVGLKSWYSKDCGNGCFVGKDESCSGVIWNDKVGCIKEEFKITKQDLTEEWLQKNCKCVEYCEKSICISDAEMKGVKFKEEIFSKCSKYACEDYKVEVIR